MSGRPPFWARFAPSRAAGRTGDGWVPVLVVLVALAGLALRAWLLSTPLGRTDSDEAVGGLIARHLLRGEWSNFYWGQAYGGTLESIVAAPLTAVCNSGLVMKSLMILLYAVGAWLVWRIGLRTVGERPALLASLLFWLAPAAFVWYSTKARGWYGAALVLGLTAVLLALRLAEEVRTVDLVLLGLVLGLSVWTAPLVLYVGAPAAAWLAASRPAVLRHAWVVLPGAVLGAAPWIVSNARNDWRGLEGGVKPFAQGYLENLAGFFTGLLPRTVGLRMAYSEEWLGGAVAVVVYVVLLALFAVYAVRAFRAREPATVLVAVAVAYPVLFSFPEASGFVGEPRYGLLLAPILALLIARGLAGVVKSTRVLAAVVSVAALGTVISSLRLLDYSEQHPEHWSLTPPDLQPLKRYLDDQGVDAVFGDYWMAYALVSETDERIIASPILRSSVRYLPYDWTVKVKGFETYVFSRQSPEDFAFEAKLRNGEIAYRRDVVGAFTVYRLDRRHQLADEDLRGPPPER